MRALRARDKRTRMGLCIDCFSDFNVRYDVLHSSSVREGFEKLALAMLAWMLVVSLSRQVESGKDKRVAGNDHHGTFDHLTSATRPSQKIS